MHQLDLSRDYPTLRLNAKPSLRINLPCIIPFFQFDEKLEVCTFMEIWDNVTVLLFSVHGNKFLISFWTTGVLGFHVQFGQS